MAYEKTTWVSGETALSADNMNNIEDGIETLDNKFSCTRFTFDSPVSGAQGVIGYGYKDNTTGTVRIYFTARFTTDIGTSTSLFSIPSEYRPSANNPAPCVVVTNANASTTGYAIITSEGTVTQGLSSYCRGITGFAEY